MIAGSTVLDRYVLQSVLGRGGMGVVYSAVDSRLGRSVAVKVVDGAAAGAAGHERSEAGMLARLGHPGLVTLFDAVLKDGRAYLVMELVDGPDLRQRLDRAPLDGAEAAVLASDVAGALQHIHEHGVVHRDVKPANILLAPARSSDRPFDAKLSDFGIARLVDSTRVTRPGLVMGTASYLSPEQALGKEVGPASDVYSLGLVLLEALTGSPAFEGSGAEVLTARLVRDPMVPRSVDPRWAALLSDMTRRRPERRPDADEVQRRAQRISDPRRPPLARATIAASESMSRPSTVPTRPGTRSDTLIAAAESPSSSSPRDGAAPRSERGAARPLLARVKAAMLGLIAAAGILVVVLLTANGTGQAGADQPASSPLPSVAGTLGVHLHQLMEGVTP